MPVVCVPVISGYGLVTFLRHDAVTRSRYRPRNRSDPRPIPLTPEIPCTEVQTLGSLARWTHGCLDMHVDVKSLPVGLRAALSQAQITTGSVALKASDDVSVSSFANDGQRAFATVVSDISRNCIMPMLVGSYGGRNGFTTTPLDRMSDAGLQSIPENGAIVTGTIGKYATIALRPATYVSIVAPGSDFVEIVANAGSDALEIARSVADLAKGGLSDGEAWTLYAFSGFKSHYRKEYLGRLRDKTANAAGTDAIVDSLVARGYLKRASNGATQITTSGRNAARACPGVY